VIALMSEGAKLQLTYERPRGAVWRLSVLGIEVPDVVARAVITSERVVGVGGYAVLRDAKPNLSIRRRVGGNHG
jgi:hypothetical protein